MTAASSQIALARLAQLASYSVFVAILYLARDVLIPVALGSLVAFLMTPLVNRLQRLGISNVFAVIISATGVFTLLGALLFGLSINLTSLADDLPQYVGQAKSKISSVTRVVESLTGRFIRIAEEVSATESNLGRDTNEQGDTKSASMPNGRTDSEDQSELLLAPFGELNPFESQWRRESDHPTGGSDSRPHDGKSPVRPLYVREVTSSRIDWKTWAGGAAVLAGPIGTTGLVVVIALFALIYRDDLQDRIISVISQGNYVVTADALNEATSKIGRYLVAQTALNVSYGAIFGAGLLIIGFFFAPDRWFPYASLLAIIAGVVRYIPYVGPLIGAAVPILFSAFAFPGFQIVLLVGGMILVLELISNNLVEPWVYGTSTGVSPMAVIFAVIFWGWLWGPIGILLATPLTVCFVVLGKHVPRFRFLSTLLSDTSQVKPSVRGYQRLLTGDQHKIDNFIAEQAKKLDVPKFLDKNFIPLVKLIESDSAKREVHTAEFYKILELSLIQAELIDSHVNSDEPEDSAKTGMDLARMIDQIPHNSTAETEPTPTAEAEREHLPLLSIIPVRNQGEHLFGRAMAKLVSDHFRAVIIDTDDLLDREAKQIIRLNPDIVLICVIPPQGKAQAQFWVSNLRQRGYEGMIIVACLGKFKHFDEMFTRFRNCGTDWLVTSAQQLLSKLIFAKKKAENAQAN